MLRDPSADEWHPRDAICPCSRVEEKDLDFVSSIQSSMRSSLRVALLALWGGSSRALTVVPLAPASARWSIATAPPRAAEARCKLGFKPKELVVGEKAEGIVSKITDYGCFVSLCGGQQLGLLHIRQLADGKRMLKNEVEDFVEEVPQQRRIA